MGGRGRRADKGWRGRGGRALPAAHVFGPRAVGRRADRGPCGLATPRTDGGRRPARSEASRRFWRRPHLRAAFPAAADGESRASPGTAGRWRARATARRESTSPREAVRSRRRGPGRPSPPAPRAEACWRGGPPPAVVTTPVGGAPVQLGRGRTGSRRPLQRRQLSSAGARLWGALPPVAGPRGCSRDGRCGPAWRGWGGRALRPKARLGGLGPRPGRVSPSLPAPCAAPGPRLQRRDILTGPPAVIRSHLTAVGGRAETWPEPDAS